MRKHQYTGKTVVTKQEGRGDTVRVLDTQQQAFARIEIKAVDEKTRRFKGIATTATPDRSEDIVDPAGAEFALPIAFLYQHDSTKPIGWIDVAKRAGQAWEVEGYVATPEPDAPATITERLNTAWYELKTKLVRGLSIGFNPKEWSFIKETGGIHWLRWEWLELSLVTIPANSEATITAIKSADEAARRALKGALGTQPGSRLPAGKPGSPSALGSNLPAAGGQPLSKGKTVKTLAEMIEARSQKNARMQELITLRQTEARQFTADEAKEFDDLEADVSSLDDDIRIKRFEERQAGNATTVKGSTGAEGSGSRGGMSFVKKTDPDDKFKGQAFTRLAIAKAAAFMGMKDGNFVSPGQIAEQRWGKSHPNLVAWIKAAVAGGGTDSGEWGSELAQADTRYSGDFVQFLYSMTVFDKLPLREVPGNVHIKGQDGAATGYWVGQSKAIPVTKPDFSDVELKPLKVGAIAVCSKELIRSSDPSAELWIRDSLAQASAQRVDQTFLSAAAAVNGVSPAGILNGVSPLSPSGTDAAAVRTDLMALYQAFLNAKNASGLVQIMTPSMAKALSLLVNTLGQTEFAGLNANGGTLLGDTVVTGDNVTPGQWILLKPSDIWKIGDTGVEISMSGDATIEQDTAPTGASDTPVAASATLVSMWQTESVAFKVVRGINFAKRRATAVSYLQDAEYGGVVS